MCRLWTQVKRFFAGLYLYNILFFAAGITIRLLNAFGVWVPAAAAKGGSGAIGEINIVEFYNNLSGVARLSINVASVIAAGPLYFGLCHSSPWQATFGKRLLNIYVTDNNGGRISIVRSFGRWIAKIILNFHCLSLISIITIAATKKKKALHDFVVQTLVLNGRPTPSGSLGQWRVWVFVGIPIIWWIATMLAVM